MKQRDGWYVTTILILVGKWLSGTTFSTTDPKLVPTLPPRPLEVVMIEVSRHLEEVGPRLRSSGFCVSIFACLLKTIAFRQMYRV